MWVKGDGYIGFYIDEYLFGEDIKDEYGYRQYHVEIEEGDYISLIGEVGIKMIRSDQ